MKVLLFATLLFLTAATAQEADPQYTFLLHFPADNSLEVCKAYSFAINSPVADTTTVEVADCNPDTIFKNGFE